MRRALAAVLACLLPLPSSATVRVSRAQGGSNPVIGMPSAAPLPSLSDVSLDAPALALPLENVVVPSVALPEAALERQAFSEAGHVAAAPTHPAPRDLSGALRGDREIGRASW